MAVPSSSPPSTSPPSTPRGVAFKLLIALIPAAAIGTLAFVLRTDEDPQLPPGLTHARFGEAEALFRERSGRPPRRDEALALAGELAEREGDLETALACVRAVSSDDPRLGAAAVFEAGRILLKLDRADEAERAFREYLGRRGSAAGEPGDRVAAARSSIRYILSVELRFEDRHVFLEDLHVRGAADVYDSKLLFFPHLVIWHSQRGRDRLDRFLAEDPRDPVLRAARGRYLTTAGRLDEARAVFEGLLAERPGDRRAIAGLLECLFEEANWSDFAEILRQAPEWRPNDPWLLIRMRAELALHERRWADAEAGFRRLLDFVPSDPRGSMGLATALDAQGREQEARVVRHRSQRLAEIRVKLPLVDEASSEASAWVAETCRECGLEDAAAAFAEHARRIGERAPTAVRARTSE